MLYCVLSNSVVRRTFYVIVARADGGNLVFGSSGDLRPASVLCGEKAGRPVPTMYEYSASLGLLGLLSVAYETTEDRRNNGVSCAGRIRLLCVRAANSYLVRLNFVFFFFFYDFD